MKILHIDLVEFDSLDELKTAFINNAEHPEMSMHNAKLVSSKKLAEKIITAPDNNLRVFWYSKFKFDGAIGFLMHECLID